MANLTGFDATQVEPNTFEALPQGVYNAIITESNWKQTQSGTGRYLELKFQICDGDFKGRVVYARLNLENASHPKTVEIARGQLSAICRAVGILQPKDSCELHNLPLAIKVACRKNDNTNEIVNDVKGFYKKGSAETAAAAQEQKQVDDTPPWKAQ